MARSVKPPPATLVSHIGALVQVMAELLAAHMPGDAVEDGPSPWIFATRTGDPDGVLGSWLQADGHLKSEPAQQRCLPLSSFLSIPQAFR